MKMVNEAWRCFQNMGYVGKKSFEFIKKLLLTKFPTYLFKYKDQQSTW